MTSSAKYLSSATEKFGCALLLEAMGRLSQRDAPIYPVWDIQSSVRTQRREIVRGDGLRLAGPLEHEQLWENGD